MTAETPVATLTRFSKVWNDLDIDSLADELRSESNETRNLQDTYNYQVKNGELIDPSSGKPILNFVAPGIERVVTTKLQNWATKHNEGSALWISPPLEGVYPLAKAIISEISYLPDGTKVVQNRAITFDDQKIINPSRKRGTLYEFGSEPLNYEKIFHWIERKTNQNVNRDEDNETISLAYEYAKRIMSGESISFVISEMSSTGFIGSSPISCPIRNESTSGWIFGGWVINQTRHEGFSDQYGSLEFDCPHCHKTNKREIGKLLEECQHCKKDVRCGN